MKKEEGDKGEGIRTTKDNKPWKGREERSLIPKTRAEAFRLLKRTLFKVGLPPLSLIHDMLICFRRPKNSPKRTLLWIEALIISETKKKGYGMDRRDFNL
ncbi:MAG: hypothetical protein AB1410_03640 [Acidobacteriota bacterium]